jgi:hypothetical protein
LANPFQQRSRLRKIIYFGLILALFTVSLLFRRFHIEPEATALQLREASRGEAELASAALQRVLVGSRGIATCVLWNTAKEKQKKHQWNELELVVGYITKLQPHFLLPWRYLSWNLAFNVAVECDRARDKYYFITRGLELQAEGERRNQGSDAPGGLRFPGSPDMRFEMGFFYQLKIGSSDEKHFMRCLLDLSCIDPLERDPDRFWEVDARGVRGVKENVLEEFCRRHPRLVRRLVDHLGRTRSADIVAFLADNKDVPSRFGAVPTDGSQYTPLKKPRDQFPILPNPKNRGTLPDPTVKEFPMAFDVFQAAHAWYAYAQEPLPPPSPEALASDDPVDPMHYRLPKMSTPIFRSYPSRTLFHIAENLEEEGWFDNEAGWTVRNNWFKPGPGRGPEGEVTVGTESKYHADKAWQLAYLDLLDFGRQNGLYYTPRERKRMEEQARLFREKYSVAAGTGIGGQLRPELRKGGMGESHDAHVRLHWHEFYRTQTNLDAFLNQAAVEKEPDVVTIRKLFFQANRKDLEGAPGEALEIYEEALPRWMDVLLAHQQFRHLEEIQEDAYERERKYLSLYLKRLPQQQVQQLGKVVQGTLQLGAMPGGLTPLAGLPLLELDPRRRSTLVPFRRCAGPMEMTYVFEVPATEPGEMDLKTFLAFWTQGAQPVPLAVSPSQIARTLTLRSVATLPTAAQDKHLAWWPLLSEQAVRAVRQLRRLDRPSQEQTQVAPASSGG